MEKSLMKVQVGPVQEFIAQARSTRDMWAGSYLLSWLTAAAMKAFKDDGCEFVFPVLKDQPLYEMYAHKTKRSEALIPTLPNVFMMLVPAGEEERLANASREALKAELQKIGKSCWEYLQKELHAKESWKERWDEQIKRFPRLNWHAIPLDESQPWSEQRKKLDRQLAARRNTRDFEQWGIYYADGKLKTEKRLAGSSKDVLSGKEEIIGDEDFWDRVTKPDNGTLFEKSGPYGAMNCIKRLFPHQYLEKSFGERKKYWDKMSVLNTRNIASRNKAGDSSAKDENGESIPNNPYFAVLAMDGDRMGRALERLRDSKEYTKFSRTLARFSEEKVDMHVVKAGGQLVYAGGDDVLILAPADAALNLAEGLRNCFIDVMGEYRDEGANEMLDASCGIAVAHYKHPLQRAVDEARDAEHRAKNMRGRAAFEVALLKRSGETIHWGGKWDGKAKALDVYRDFSSKMKKHNEDEEAEFSGRFAYALAELLQPYRLEDVAAEDDGLPESKIDLKSIIEKEFEHVQKRQALKEDAEVAGALEYLEELPAKGLQDFSKLFLTATFMNRPREE